MKQSKTIRYFLKQLICWSMNLSLIFPMHLSAADRENNGNFAGKLVGGLGAALSTGASIYNQYQSSKAAQEEMARTKLALTPIEFEKSYFPGCKTLPAMMSSVYGLCEGQPGDQAQALTFRTYGEQAAKNKNLYERYTTLGNKEFANNGLSCIEESIKRTKDLLEQRIVSLRELLNKVTTEKTNLDNALKPQKEAISELEGYLNGGDKQESDHTRQYSSLFRQVANDASCGSFLDPVKVQEYAQKGLKNVEKKVNDIRLDGGNTDLVNNLIRNQGNIQASIRKYSRQVRRSLKKRGVASSLDELTKNNMDVTINNPLLQGSPAIKEVQSDVVRQFKDERASLNRKFERLEEPGLRTAIFQEGNHNFKEKVNDWRDKKQNECLMKRISLDDTANAYNKFVGKIDHADASVRSRTNIESLQREILNHLKNDNLSITQKQKLVRKSINSKSSRKVQIMSYDTINGTENQKNWDPAALLGTYVEGCLSEYSRIKVNGEGQSYKAIEEEAKKIYKEYKSMERDYPRKVSQAIVDKMIHCHQDGEPIPYTVTSNSCNSDKLNLSSNNFCLGQSVECAKTVNLCSKKIDDTIQRITKTQQDIATNVNTAVTGFVNYQKQLVESLKQQSLAQAKQLEDLFPESKFLIPVDLAIVDPEKIFKIDGEDISVAVLDPEKIMEQFEKKVTDLSNQIEKQNEKVIAEIEGERDKVAGNYEKEIANWERLTEKCTQGVIAFNQMDADRVAKEEEQRAEDREVLGKFCKSFSKFRLAPGCDEPLADLDEATGEVAHLINTGEVTQMLGSVEANCIQAQNQADEQERGSQYDKDIFDKCEELKLSGNYTGQCDGISVQKNKAIIAKLYKEKHSGDDDNDRKPASASIAENKKYTEPITVPHCESINDVSYSFSDMGGFIEGLKDLSFSTRQ